tara:strand:+ start:8110 stop:8445 length:336 start_codon:yes stop_codon:yes gene_type:complete
MRYQQFYQWQKEHFVEVNGMSDNEQNEVIEIIFESAMAEAEEKINLDAQTNISLAKDMIADIDKATDDISKYLLANIDRIAEMIMTDENYNVNLFSNHPQVLIALQARGIN